MPADDWYARRFSGEGRVGGDGVGGRLGRSDLVPGAAAVAALLALAFVFQFPLWLVLPLAVGVYVGVRWLLPSAAPADPEVAPGVTRSELAAALRGAEEKVAAIRALARQSGHPTAGQRALDIGATAERIIAGIRDDPKDLKDARHVLDRYLDATRDLLTTYNRLAARDVASARGTLAKVEGDVLPRIDAQLRDLYEKLQRDDVIDLEVATEMLDMDLGLGGGLPAAATPPAVIRAEERRA